MTLKNISFCSALVLAFGAGFLFNDRVHAQSKRVFELRTYHTLPGRLPALQRRFRDHTVAIFKRHGMTSVGYWVPQDAPASENTLIYIISHESREAAAKNWAA